MNNNSKLKSAVLLGISLGCIVLALILIAIDGPNDMIVLIALIPAFISPLYISGSAKSCTDNKADQTGTTAK